MACKYYYKGHEFNSELELDDFLLEKKPFEPLLGDMVFSNTQPLNIVLNKLVQVANDAVLVRARRVYKDALRNNATYTEDGEALIDKPPYIGVNKFLGKWKNSDDKLPINEFREQEYWDKQFADWKNGDYTQELKELFGITGDKGPEVTSKAELERLKGIIVNKWKNQAKAGNAIHNVLLLFFTYDELAKRYLYEMTDEEFKQHCLNNLDADNKDFITEPVIEKTIQYARTLHLKIINEIGDNCLFLPEFTVALDTNTTNPDTLLGMIDLLIVDTRGRVHILDYKTSVHDYQSFDHNKRTAYNHLLGVYKRMLEKYGLNMFGGKLLIAPIQIKNFHLESDGKWTYDDVESLTTYVELNLHDYVWLNINLFMSVPFQLNASTDLAKSTVTLIMTDAFPDYSNSRLSDDASTKAWLKRLGMLKRDNNGDFVFNKYELNSTPIKSNDEVEFVKKVTEYFKTSNTVKEKTEALMLKLEDMFKNGYKATDFPTPYYKAKNINWLRDTLKIYDNGNWEIDYQMTELLKHFGMIILKTKNDYRGPALIDIIKVSNAKDLTVNYRQFTTKENPYKKRLNLLGALGVTDLESVSKLNNLMVEAAIGNVEMMEAMLVLNQIEGFLDYTIGNILVVSPNVGLGLSASNEELLYCFNELAKRTNLKQNKFKSGEIKLATKYDLVRQKASHIINTGLDTKWKDTYKSFEMFQPAISMLDRMIDGPESTALKIQNLLECLDLLVGRGLDNRSRSSMQRELDITYHDLAMLKEKHVDLYNAILVAIGDLKGISYRQLLRDNYQWFSDITKVGTQGLTGNYSDNPGNLRSETLNLVTKLVTEAYLNVRDELLKENIKIKKLVEELKKQKTFGKLKENTIGNQVNLYRKMYEWTANGDIRFVDPKTLEGAEKEFLEYMLYKINKNRFPTLSDALIKLGIDSGNLSYYEVPLCMGGLDSTNSEQGLLETLKAKFEYLWPPKAWEIAKKRAEGIFNREDKLREASNDIEYKMTNIFDVGEGDNRLDAILRMKDLKLPLELNFETLLLKHIFAYSTQRNVDAVFPLIKSSMIHIKAQGALLNDTFDNDVKYLREYIENKVFNKTIVNPEHQSWVKTANVIKYAASLFTLAVAPVLMFYQPLQGLWNDISLMIRQPDGKNSFTFLNFRNAFSLVFSDLIHFSDKPTLCSALNLLYGINDMDMNTYVDRISTAKKGVWNFTNFLFKFASRPDFYNRMTIFTSLMMADGCLEAHHVNENGELIYDWTKDKRFSKFAAAVKAGNGNSSDPEIAKLRSLYYAVALLFVNEHAKVVDKATGKLVDFELNMNKPMDLPRAYTNKEAESMKSLGDDIYGYYSHEKKSLIMSTCVGSLWLQFRTYWSGKKNQYLAHGGVKLRGNWEQYSENGLNYYYQVDENGNILYEQEPLTEAEMREKGLPLVAPVMLWKGLWLEGIFLTLWDLTANMFQHGVKKGWDSKFGENVDPYLRKVYKNNMQQLAYDLFMFAIVGSILGALLGDWLDKLKKDTVKNRDIVTGAGVAAANVAVMSVKNSFLDFNFFSSIGDPFGQWTPFSVEWLTRMYKLWWNTAMGDEDFWDAVVKSSGGLKQVKPVLDAIKPDIFRTEREGGTFGKK